MNKTVLLYASLALTGVFVSAVSQVMLKKAALKKYDSKIKEYLNPLVIFAYILFVGTTFLGSMPIREFHFLWVQSWRQLVLSM